ncbi:MAG TPA: hypothetical protein VF162_05325 [Streptosporangiaceae bacterium]
MAIRPGPPHQQRAPGGTDTAELRLRPARRSRRSLAGVIIALLALCGLAVAGYGIRGQLKPRTFTPAQQRRIEAWEIAKRWRTIPKAQLFPASVTYKLGSRAAAKGALRLTATRLEIAGQDTCTAAAGASHKFMSVLGGNGCTALLRSTYTDSTRSLVVTAGIAVLKSEASAADAARFLTGGPASGEGGIARQLVLKPFRVFGTPAASYGFPQRQLSWVISAGPYLVMTTVGYADGRPRVRIAGDSYAYQEMTSLARGVAARVAAPLAVPPPVPRCPGVPSC